MEKFHEEHFPKNQGLNNDDYGYIDIAGDEVHDFAKSFEPFILSSLQSAYDLGCEVTKAKLKKDVTIPEVFAYEAGHKDAMSKVREMPAFKELQEHQGQADEHGMCVIVSRQALEEVIGAVSSPTPESDLTSKDN